MLMKQNSEFMSDKYHIVVIYTSKREYKRNATLTLLYTDGRSERKTVLLPLNMQPTLTFCTFQTTHFYTISTFMGTF